MRLAQLIADTADDFLGVLDDEDRLAEFDLTRAKEFDSLITAVESIYGMTKADRRRKWYRLALQTLEEAKRWIDNKNDLKFHQLIREAERYFLNAVKNEPHRVDFVVGPEGTIQRSDEVTG